ncbi:MAG: galactose mutarotase [Acidobacteriaceae bacterium]|nr:galactose mutarotase [Acidobacteriaceae bacterium]
MLSELNVEPWGQAALDNQPAHRITLKNDHLRVVLTDLGARIVSVFAPDREGNVADVVLGYETLAEYDADTFFLGATCGRFANRIRYGQFWLDGKSFQIPTNDPPNSLHGGAVGFDKHVWQWREVNSSTAEFTLVSPDGDQGFPGTMQVRVRFSLLGRTLRIAYHATTTAPTVVNLTNHAYFNLTGDFTREILGHEFRLAASRFLPTTKSMIPTGELTPVEETPFDFRSFHAVGSRVTDPNTEIVQGSGIDHNFVLDAAQPAAFVQESLTGRTLSVETSEPGLQFYTGNHLDPAVRGKGGVPFGKRTGFCLETQHFPDSPNQPSFPSTTLRPGEVLTSTTSYTFGVI